MENAVEAYIRSHNGGRLETVVPGGNWAESWEKILPGLTRLDQTGTTKPREWSRWQVGEVLEYTLLGPKGEFQDSYLVRWHLPELPGAPAAVVEQRVPGQLLRVVHGNPFPEEWRPGLTVHHVDGWQGVVDGVDWTKPGGPILVTKYGAQGFRCAPRGWAPDKLRIQQQQQPAERGQSMGPYRFVTGHEAWRNAIVRWCEKFGFDIHPEDDGDGSVGEAHALLVDVNGTELARLRLADGQDVFTQIRAAIKGDTARDVAAAGDQVPAAARTAPAGAAEPARAARELGQVVTEAQRSATPATESSTESGTSSTESAETEPIVLVDLQLIDDLPGGNHRRHYDPVKLEELTELVRQHGVLEPVLVRRAGDRYQLIAGYRRREAARRVTLAKIPARVRECSVEQARLEMYVENGGREDLNPMDEARAFRSILDDNPGWGHAELAARVGKRRQYVGVMLQLLNLPANLQRMVAQGDMAVETARQFLADTANLPDFLREKVGAVLERERPSIRQAPEVIARAIAEVIPQQPKPQPAARAAGTSQPVQPPVHQTGQNTQQPGPGPVNAGQNVQQPARQPDRPPAPPASAGRMQPTPPQMEPLSAPPRTGPKPDPQVEHARALAEVGRPFWKGSPQYGSTADGAVMFQRECYLPLGRLFKHWELRQELGATSLPRSFGNMEINVPEQRFFVRADEPSPPHNERHQVALIPDGNTLKVRCGHITWSSGGVDAVYSGNPVYYRVALVKAENGGHKTLAQQVVIQDGGRHIIITGSGTAMIRADLVPQWADLVNELPGLPGAEGSN